jgi:hypothetical protein
MEPRLAKQALAVYVFFPAVGPDREHAYVRLRGLWSACGDRLGMSEPIAALELPAELPASPVPAGDPRPLAARKRPGPGICQALVLRTHDVVTLLVLQAPQPSSGMSWQQLDQLWSAVAADAPPGAVLGDALLYLAVLTDAPDTGAAGGPGQGDAAGAAGRDIVSSAEPSVRAALPASPDAREQWWRRGSQTQQGFALWEASAALDSRLERKIAVIAGQKQEADLDHWVWTRGDAALPPFGRYLLHTAKVRYELRVHAGQQVRELRNDADAEVSNLLHLLAAENEPGGVPESEEGLIAASTRLLQVQAGSAGLVTAVTRLREMRRTVQIAGANMAAALGPSSAETGLLADDRALADWFAQQLDDDLVYLEAARERTRDVTAATATVVQHRLQQRQEQGRQRQERFNLLQTAIIGAVIMALTAVQALGYQLHLPGPVKPAVIAALGAMALLLASIVVRLALSSGRQPLAWLSHVAAGLTVASLAWLAVAWVSADVLHRLAAPVTTRMLAGIGFVLGAGAAYSVSARRPRNTTYPERRGKGASGSATEMIR